MGNKGNKENKSNYEIISTCSGVLLVSIPLPFLIIGLTGPIGAGCTTLAQKAFLIMNRGPL